MKRVCVVTSYDENFKAIGDLTSRTMKRYALRHNFDCIVEKVTEFDRPPAWHRVKLIPAIFDLGYEFVLWLDADALFARYDENICKLVSPDKHLYLVEHDYPPPQTIRVPNTGVMLVRNCDWSRTFFTTLWGMTQYLDHPWWENAAAIKLFGYHSLLEDGPHAPNEDVLRHVEFLPVSWNCVPNLSGPDDPVVRHYAGCSRQFRHANIPPAVLNSCLRAADMMGLLQAAKAVVGARVSARVARKAVSA